MMFSKKEKIAYDKGYRVFNGIVYSHRNIQLSLCINKNNYYYFSVYHNNRSLTVMVHRLVAYQKYKESIYHSGICVRHLDGNSLNNIDNNICIGTNSENMMDISQIDRMSKAITASNKIRKFSDTVVSEIKEKRKNGATYKELMDEYDISSKGTLSYMINNEYVTNK